MREAMLIAALLAASGAVQSWRRDRELNGPGQTGGHRLEALALVGRRVRAAGIRVPAPPGFGRAPRPAEAAAAGADVGDLRAGSLALFGVAGLSAAGLTGSLLGLAAAGACIGFGWLFPDLWLRASARARADEIERQAPLALDLIASAVAAGIPIDDAMALAAEVSTGALREELQVALANLRLGHRRHAELTDLAERTASASLRRLGSALRMSDRLGVPLADGLRRQAARARVEQTRHTQERAARASPRILLVVVFILVPAAVLPVMTALALVAAHSVGPVIDGRM
jgi:tight adherence protein C